MLLAKEFTYSSVAAFVESTKIHWMVLMESTTSTESSLKGRSCLMSISYLATLGVVSLPSISSLLSTPESRKCRPWLLYLSAIVLVENPDPQPKSTIWYTVESVDIDIDEEACTLSWIAPNYCWSLSAYAVIWTWMFLTYCFAFYGSQCDFWQ